MTSTTHEPIAYAAYIGLDWADKEHLICLRAADSVRIETLMLKHKPELLHDWAIGLRQRFDGRPVALALEQTRGAVIYALLRYDFIHIYPVPPKSLARYREAMYPSQAKDDPSDAALLLEWAQLHRDKMRLWVPDCPESRALARMAEFRRKTVAARVRVTNQLTQVLKESFPQGLEWAGSLDKPMACDLLERWPNLAALRKTKAKTLEQFYHQHHCRNHALIQQRIQEMHRAVALTEDPAVMETSVPMVHTLVAELRVLIRKIDILERDIEQRFKKHADYEIFDSLPGAGPVFAARLAVAMGSDRSRFASAVEVQQYSGIAPVTKRSGKKCSVQRRWAAPKFLKQTFHEFAALSIPQCRWAKAYYEAMRQKGNKHHAAVRALAYKWIRIIYICWKERKPYDDAAYLRALERRQSPVFQRLAKAA
jgi:transposase